MPIEFTFPMLRPGLRSCLPVSSLHATSPSLSPPSPCCESDSDSDWAREGVSEPWLRGEEDLDGDSRNFLMAGWLSTAGSHLEVCYNTREIAVSTYVYEKLHYKKKQKKKLTSGFFVMPTLA